MRMSSESRWVEVSKFAPIRHIIAFFRYARQGENAGYGIDKIMRWTKLTGLEVEFDSGIISSTVTYPLPLKKSDQKNSPESGQNDSIKSGQHANISRGYKTGDESRSKIVEAMRRNPEISRKELSTVLGISQSAIQRHIEYLKAAKVIVRLGIDRKGLWKVLK